jgi:inosine-uridine nucleoside N-ribohydrolase
VVPFGFPAPRDSALGAVADTPQRILDIAEAYGSDLVIIAIAPVTPLAQALLLDKTGILKKVQRIYFQGNVIADTQSRKLKPDPQVN